MILSNHTVHENALNKIRMFPGRGDGPHPFEVGADMVQRYFQVMQYCARAALIKLERVAEEGRYRQTGSRVRVAPEKGGRSWIHRWPDW